MPGPNNRRGGKTKKQTKKPRPSLESTASSASHVRTPSPLSPGDITVNVGTYNGDERSPYHDSDPRMEPLILPEGTVYDEYTKPPSPFPEFPPEAFIHDPGNGHRVRSMRQFIPSFFAQSPAREDEDPIAAEFASMEVQEMLLLVADKGGVLTEEMALTLWYNKSRATSRVCPACQRLYRLGDVFKLSDPDDDEDEEAPSQPPLPQLLREQQISGLCSTFCFIAAAYNYPAAITSAWGTMAEEMDEHAWTLLNTSPEDGDQTRLSLALGMLVRMTRLHDLGLAQLVLDSDPE
uniref:Uncharacterized protein n=1 Tax=Mycena chlorophos TaxID=658473 RepID=A0ABQ0M6K7_MYCCL|nr:predicted protein [Mycena chlorophos]